MVFAGTPVFAQRALDRILASRHQVVGVLTQPDRPSGRGQKLAASPVKTRAVSAGVPVLQPPTLRDDAAQRALRVLQPDVVVVAAYGLILPLPVLAIAPCLNIHASLLPRWRGAAPIVRAIQAGDRETGVCIMQMEAGLDTGPVALSVRTLIAASDTAGTLHERLAELGARAIVDVLDAMAGVGTHAPLSFVAQSADGVTYAHKVDKAEAIVDWRLDAGVVANHIRAFDPQPGSYSALAREPLAAIRLFTPTVLCAAPQPAAPPPGRVMAVSAEGLVVACGTGLLRVAELQRAGGRRLAVAEFVRGHALAAGDMLVVPIPPGGATAGGG